MFKVLSINVLSVTGNYRLGRRELGEETLRALYRMRAKENKKNKLRIVKASKKRVVSWMTRLTRLKVPQSSDRRIRHESQRNILASLAL